MKLTNFNAVTRFINSVVHTVISHMVKLVKLHKNKQNKNEYIRIFNVKKHLMIALVLL